jgi:UDP-N-acetyl-D-galactosamine dehydrogenase
MTERTITIGIIGLGYVGLPLAVEFGKYFKTIGFDINQARVAELINGHDSTLETSDEELVEALHLSYTLNPADLADCNVYIITVPTPIDIHKRPDLLPLRKSSETVGKLLSTNDTVIYESTVYPGTTEEVCVPILEQFSQLSFNQDFFVGYSPERINPGDKTHRLPTILKVTSGSTPETADFVDNLYQKIITAGTYKAESIKVAEAAKVIENTQRDINIALINELALIFNKLNISTEAVLNAAGTKWNFLPFRPGLVGGHCIGVDPYYLTHKAQEIGYHPDMILAGRRLNDGMGTHVAQQVIELMLKNKQHIVDAKILMLGLTFKENCPDIRNTRITDIMDELTSYHAQVDVHDPWVNKEDAARELDINLIENPQANYYDAIIIGVAHEQFKTMGIEAIRKLGKSNAIIYDVKYLYPADQVDGRL